MSTWWIMGSPPADSVQISVNAKVLSSSVFSHGGHKRLIPSWLNGNLLADGTRNFGYDDENQLISVWQANAWSNNFVYDGKMRRRIERDYTWSGSAWTQTNEIHFVYDGNLVIQERDASNVPQVTYTRGNDLSGTLQGAGGIGGLLARSDRSQFVSWVMQPGGGLPWYGVHSYYHADGNGNITMLISSSQMIVAKYLYDAFGGTLAKYGLLADVNNYRFSSKEWNANSGLYYYLYRFYDPNLQRWLNRDPVEEGGYWNIGTQTWLPFSINLMAFVANNPIDEIDIFGLTTHADPSCGDPCQETYNDCMRDPAKWASSAGFGAVGGAGVDHRTDGGNQKKFLNGGNLTKYAKGLGKGVKFGVITALACLYTDCTSTLAGCMSGCPQVPDIQAPMFPYSIVNAPPVIVVPRTRY